MQLPEGKSRERGALPDSTMQRTKRNREAESGGKSNASTSWTELVFLFFFSFIFKASPSRDLRRCFSCSRQSRCNYSVLNQWTRAVLRRLGNDKATAGERRAITSKSLPFNALRIQMSRRSLTFVWQIISKRCDRARTSHPSYAAVKRGKISTVRRWRFSDKPVTVLRHSVFSDRRLLVSAVSCNFSNGRPGINSVDGAKHHQRGFPMWAEAKMSQSRPGRRTVDFRAKGTDGRHSVHL